jgi:hypothetical protein
VGTDLHTYLPTYITTTMRLPTHRSHHLPPLTQYIVPKPQFDGRRIIICSRSNDGSNIGS